MSIDANSFTDDPNALGIVESVLDLCKTEANANDFRNAVCQYLMRLGDTVAVALWWMEDGEVQVLAEGAESHALVHSGDGEQTRASILAGNLSQHTSVQPAAMVGRNIVRTVATIDGNSTAIQLLQAGNESPNARLQLAKSVRTIASAISQFRGPSQSTSGHRFHESLRLKDTCFAIANDVRRITATDRTSALVKRGRRLKVVSTSGVSEVAPRSNVIQCIQQLAQRALTQGDSFVYPTKEELPPQLERALQAYLEEAASKSVAIFALREPQHRNAAAESAEKSKAGKLVGAIAVEEFQATTLSERRQQLTALAREGGVALANSMRHEGIFLLPLWLLIGKLKKPSNLIKALLTVGLVVAALAALLLIQADFYVPADGKLLPAERRNIFAHADGTVTELMARHGQRVKEGDTLVELENVDINRQLEDLRGEILTTQQQLQSVRALLVSETTSVEAEEQGNLAPEETQLKIRLERLRSQQTLVESKLDRLTIRSPFAGEVLTWDIEQLLAGRPVSRGQQLMTIANTEGEWELELAVRDRHIGELLEARRASSDPLRVEFALVTSPEERHGGQLKHIAEAAVEDEILGSTFLVITDIGAEPLPNLRAGASVQAKVYCGKRALGSVWFRDVVAFFQRRVLFWLKS